MKELFPGHFKESEGHLREIWDTSLFVFGANVLLNLYRPSDRNKQGQRGVFSNIRENWHLTWDLK